MKIFIDFQSKELLDVIFWGPVSINRLRGGDGGWERERFTLFPRGKGGGSVVSNRV